MKHPKNISLTVLGSGTSSGVPVINCDCVICTSSNPKNQRLRTSCYIQADGVCLLIDTSPDLRQQALRYGIKRVDAVLNTHTHADHIHGIDELRVFNAHQKQEIPIYGNKDHLSHLEKMFPYIFNPPKEYPSLTPKLTTEARTGLFDVKGIPVQMIPCLHGPAGYTYNYRVGGVAWVTDTNGIPKESKELLQGLDYLFIDGLRHRPHPTHFHLEKSLKAIEELKPKKAYLIHLCHDYDHDDMNKQLPKGVELAFDGLTVTV
ncbi:MAG: MBL fold metallo-hydrolase [Deltaproteobacteria bacterium]|nr:MBL fold metallo-hydrolase [Deltaproteobacteria bacterium]